MKRLIFALGLVLLLPSLAFANFPPITKGSTSVIVPLAILDSASTTGARKASILFGDAGLVCKYTREGATVQPITLQTMTAGTWASGGFIYNATTLDYELGVPDAAFATGGTARWVKISCLGAAGMVQVDAVIPLVDFGPYSSGQAQAVGASTLTLATTDVSGDNALAGGFQITIDSATTGANQSLCVLSNVSATKVATMAQAWPVTITGTVKYSLAPNAACKSVLALSTDTYAELSAIPGATPTLVQMVQWVYQLMRFKLTQTSTTVTALEADSATSLATAATSDDGTTFTRGKFN